MDGGKMTYAKGQHPGAIWLKCDFQCHTPRDIAWRGGPNLPGGTDELEARRVQWAEEFLQACKARGLMVVAVTDHHDAAMLHYFRDIGHIRGVTVFPGIEVTC